MIEAQTIAAIDFTCRPSRQKPIVVAIVEGVDRCWRITELQRLTTWPQFEGLLSRRWFDLVGIDCPLGMPRDFTEWLSLPDDWAAMANYLGNRSMADFANDVRSFQQGRPKGQKEPLRACDRLANARSPLKLFYQPVGRMLWRAIPALRFCGLAPVTAGIPTARTVAEVYPALIARRLIGRRSYKTEKLPDPFLPVRQQMVDGLCGGLLEPEFGFQLTLDEPLRRDLVQDFRGDCLDAVLASYQSIWAHLNPKMIVGICQSEGWIADPGLRWELAA